MAICNILGNLEKNTGTFLTFSQYIDDLTKWQSESDSYRIVPTKFVALNIKPLNRPITDESTENTGTTINYNTWFPRLLTNFFENQCAYLKKHDVYGEWVPPHSSNIFWKIMTTKLGSSDVGIEPIITEDDIMYIGDINIQSHDEVYGQGYSEIYCYIPNEAKKGIYKITSSETNPANPIDDSFSKGAPLLGYENYSEYRTSYRMRYDNKSKYFISHEGDAEDLSFTINAIVVLYDVYNNGEKEHEGIPMGLYLTGLIDEEGVIQNEITKFVSNEDVFGAGTSYGLRICSRYTVSPKQESLTHNTEVMHYSYNELSKVLSQISKSQDKMDQILSKINTDQQVNKSLIDLFKNTQVNVPYIKKVNDIDYWFVNGKKLQPVYQK